MYYIDIGNSYAKIYNSLNRELSTIETVKIIDWLDERKNKKSQILICSVALEISNKIKKLYPDIIILDNKIYNKLIEIDNELLYKKGSDRIITAYGAIWKYGKNVIVVDMGTCVTVDVICESKYVSGFIFPGLQILRTALNQKVKQLPVAVEPHVLSNDIIDTNDQIFWGNIYGMIGAINHFVNLERAKRENINFEVIMTGGTIKEFKEFLVGNKLEELFDFDYQIDSMLIFTAMEKINEAGLI